ncbi:MAG: AAA family ATPase [Candidatus Saccharimonadales bacterium]
MNNLPFPGHILITGSSATGKSTISKVIKSRGIPCIDADYEGEIAYWEHKVSGHEEIMPENPPDEWGATHNWKWKIGKLTLVLEESSQPLVICGTANNREDAYGLFDQVLVLTASRKTLNSRLETRENNAFGKLKNEREWALTENERQVDFASRNGLTIIDTSSMNADNATDAILQVSKIK